MSYQHQYVDGTRIHFPLGKVVCIGRNYGQPDPQRAVAVHQAG